MKQFIVVIGLMLTSMVAGAQNITFADANVVSTVKTITHIYDKKK